MNACAQEQSSICHSHWGLILVPILVLNPDSFQLYVHFHRFYDLLTSGGFLKWGIPKSPCSNTKSRSSMTGRFGVTRCRQGQSVPKQLKPCDGEGAPFGRGGWGEPSGSIWIHGIRNGMVQTIPKSQIEASLGFIRIH